LFTQKLKYILLHIELLYIKKDLRKAALAIKLYGNEVLEDEFNLNGLENGKETE
jgi:hypothetical protein